MSEEKIPKWKALAVLSSDALSSVAYATEEILLALALVPIAMAYSVPVGLAIITLLVIVSMSYRETIEYYPNGGGAYVVAKENLGTMPALVAGAALLIGYVLTVAVSISAGVRAITSAFPFFYDHRVALGISLIVLLTILNLRGLRESATIFAIPTYVFIISFLAMIGIGFYRVLTGNVTTPSGIPPQEVFESVYPVVPLLLILRAFSSGCAALTGIEAISNAVPSFRPPANKNAKTTLLWMAGIMAVLFFGITALSRIYGIMPDTGTEVHSEAAVSILARAIMGDGWFYYLIQASTAMILVLAANTCYSGFPWLAAILAKDRFLPRQFAILGDKLVYSNAIIGLSMAAAGLLFLFDADTHALIPLYAIGVFLGFTLSQFGMVRFHLRERKQKWIRALALNLLGAITTFVVMIVVGIANFSGGAWIVVLLIPFLVMFFLHIYQHYLDVGRQLSLVGETPPDKLRPSKHTAVVPISGIHRGVLEALRYALSISNDVRACYVEINPETTLRVQEEWEKWAPEIPFIILKSPYRSVVRPILEYIDDLQRSVSGDVVTVVIPEFVTAKWWHNFLHNQTALMIRAALIFKRGKVVTSVRYHLKS